MKTSRYTVYQWRSPEPELDIDWPKVHHILGQECVGWLNQQSLKDCQLILERQGVDHTLIVEFYNSRVSAAFHLLKH